MFQPPLDGDPSGALSRARSEQGVAGHLWVAPTTPTDSSPEWTSTRLEWWDLKRILIVLSEFGYWGEELVGPLETFDEAGYEVDFATPKGKRPTPLPPSMDPQYIDPPLGKSVTSQEVADKVKALDASTRYDKPIDISAWIPERPYWSSPTLLRDMEAYYARLDEVELEIKEKYDAILLVGGSGPIVDIANNDRIHALILLFQKLNIFAMFKMAESL